MRSHCQPIASRARVVTATKATIVQSTCSWVSDNSSQTTAINGAMPNQAKKHRKKVYLIYEIRLSDRKPQMLCHCLAIRYYKAKLLDDKSF